MSVEIPEWAHAANVRSREEVEEVKVKEERRETRSTFSWTDYELNEREREFRSLFTFYMWHKQISTKYAKGGREGGREWAGAVESGEWTVRKANNVKSNTGSRCNAC